MGSFGPLPDAPEGVRRGLDLIANGIDRAVAQLSPAQHAEFWKALQAHAATERRRQGRSARLAAPPRIDQAVREALETVDGDIAAAIADLNAGGRQRLWDVLDDLCRAQVEAGRRAAPDTRRQSG